MARIIAEKDVESSSFQVAPTSSPAVAGACPELAEGVPRPRPLDRKITASYSPRPRFLPSHIVLQEQIQFLIGGSDALRQRPAIILDHAILPLQKVRNTLRFNPHFNPPQT